MSEQSEHPAGARGRVETIEPDRARQVAARRAAEVKATVPDATYLRPADATAVLEIVNADPAITAVDVICAALARVLRAMPDANAAYRDARVEQYARVNVAISDPITAAAQAVTIFDADAKDAAAIAAERRALTARVQGGEITAPETGGATCSIVDLSATRVTAFTPLLTAPHALALGVGATAAQAIVTGGTVVARPLIDLTLTTDLRALSPARSGEILDHLVRELEATGH